MNILDIEEGRESDENGFCCPCGKCSLESYLDKGCPISDSDAFPYLDLSNLDEHNKEDLKAKLCDDVDDMGKRFAKTLNEICESITKRGVSVHGFARCVINLVADPSPNIQQPLTDDTMQRLFSAKSIDEAFIIIRPYMTFFNYDLLKHITQDTGICTNDDQKWMNDYCDKFDKFCRRKVFEVPPSAVGVKEKKLKWKTFAVLMTKLEKEPVLADMDVAKRKIASLLHLRPSTLHLHRIDKGSLILVFSVPDFVYKKLFPLKPSVIAMLKTEGFIVLMSNKSETPQQSKCSFDMCF